MTGLPARTHTSGVVVLLDPSWRIPRSHHRVGAVSHSLSWPLLTLLRNLRYLPAFPYQDNPVLHTYAALLSLYTAQPSADEGLNSRWRLSEIMFMSYCVSENPAFDPILLRDAQSHLEHAKRLDPSNASIQAFLDKVRPSSPKLSVKLALTRYSSQNSNLEKQHNPNLSSNQKTTQILQSQSRTTKTNSAHLERNANASDIQVLVIQLQIDELSY